MALIADVLLIAGCLAAAFYCWVLSVRVRRLTDMDTGVGAAIASLSTQVDEMQKVLQTTRNGTNKSIGELDQRIESARETADHLGEILKTSRSKRAAPDYENRKSEAPKPVRKEPQLAKQVRANQEKTGSQPNEPLQSSSNVRRLRNAEKDLEATSDAASKSEPISDETEALSAARQLQKDIQDRVSGKGATRDRDDFVRALQTVLAAANR